MDVDQARVDRYLRDVGYACEPESQGECELTVARRHFADRMNDPGFRRALAKVLARADQYKTLCRVCRTP